MANPGDDPGNAQGDSERRRKGRSPKNPGIALKEALDRAKTLYDAEHGHAASIPTILEHWGFSPKSSGGFSAIAALKQYGLLEDEGGGDHRRARLTPLAMRILLDENDDPSDRERAIREAALTPDIIRELWELYGPQLPSDNNLRTYLRRDRAFTESGARAFLPVFRDTIEFGGLREAAESSAEFDREEPSLSATPAYIDTRPANHRDRDDPPIERADPRPVGGTQVFHIPVAPGRTVALEGDFPLTDAAWRQMMAVIEVMKPALTQLPDTTGAGDAP